MYVCMHAKLLYRPRYVRASVYVFVYVCRASYMLLTVFVYVNLHMYICRGSLHALHGMHVTIVLHILLQELVLDASFDTKDAEVLQSYLRYTVLSTYIPVLPPDEVPSQFFLYCTAYLRLYLFLCVFYCFVHQVSSELLCVLHCLFQAASVRVCVCCIVYPRQYLCVCVRVVLLCILSFSTLNCRRAPLCHCHTL
jgi:hypothetical protein